MGIESILDELTKGSHRNQTNDSIIDAYAILEDWQTKKRVKDLQKEIEIYESSNFTDHMLKHLGLVDFKISSKLGYQDEIEYYPRSWDIPNS